MASEFVRWICADLEGRPLERYGVFAVRQSPILLANLAAVLCGGPLDEFPRQRWRRQLLQADLEDGRQRDVLGCSGRGDEEPDDPGCVHCRHDGQYARCAPCQALVVDVSIDAHPLPGLASLFVGGGVTRI